VEDKVERIAVELVPHTPAWAGMAAAETTRLKGVLGNVLLDVHHIGSTSIPGIKAKPIVDMIPIVSSVEDLDRFEDAIRGLGYRWYGEFGLPGRRYCSLTDPVTGKRKYQLHCYGKGDASVARHLAFRDYLRAHPAIAKEYEAEKVRAASVRSDDVLAYNDEKNDWIKRVEQDALRWYSTR